MQTLDSISQILHHRKSHLIRIIMWEVFKFDTAWVVSLTMAWLLTTISFFLSAAHQVQRCWSLRYVHDPYFFQHQHHCSIHCILCVNIGNFFIICAVSLFHFCFWFVSVFWFFCLLNSICFAVVYHNYTKSTIQAITNTFNYNV